MLWVRDLDAADARALPGTDGAHGPFWSPNSHTIAFFTDDKLRSVEVGGGPVATLCDCVGGFGTWSTRDTILFSTTAGIVSLAGRGGTAAQVTALESGEIAHQRPWFLPDGHHFLYTAQKLGQSPVYVADLDAADKQKSQREVRQVQTSADAGTYALFVSPDFLLFRRGTTLIAQHFDPQKAQLRGEELPVEGVSRYSVSQNGVLVYETLDATINGGIYVVRSVGQNPRHGG